MEGLLEHPPLRFTICLGFVILLASSPSGAQNTPEEPASPETQGVQNPADNTVATEGKTPMTSDQFSGGPVAPNYVLGPEDVIRIDVLNVPELSGTTVRIANDGTITLPLIGRVPAAGLTSEQLRKELADKWGENYLQDPQVIVFIDQFKALPVSVIGAVEKPGLYPLTGRRTLIEVLSMAGGYGKKGTSPTGRTVLVTRNSGFGDLQVVEGMHIRGPHQIEIDLNRLLYTRDEALNIEMKPHDIVSVSKAEVVYVAGAVRRPGGFVLEDRPTMTVIQAVAMAEGFTATAAKRSARILRTNQDGSKTLVPINLGRVIKGKAQDVTLAANDVLYVPDSKSKLAGERALDTAIGTFSGWLIWRQ
jgi:polysaccharide export outer membrane protein